MYGTSNQMAITGFGVKNFFLKIGTEIRWLPLQMKIDRMARKAANDPKEYARLKKSIFGEGSVSEQEENMMSAKETERAATAMRKESQEGECSEKIIKILDDEEREEVERRKMIEKAINTQKLIDYAFFYMVDERAAVIKRPQVEKEIINGIAAIFGFPKIYESAGVGYLNQYDMEHPEDYMETSKFLLSIADIKRKTNDPCFMERVKKRMEDLMLATAHPEDDEPEIIDVGDLDEQKKGWTIPIVGSESNVIRPLEFQQQPTSIEEIEKKIMALPIKGDLPDDLFLKMNGDLGPLCSYHYRFEMNGDLVKMYVYRGGGIEEFYTIDPGLIMGLGKTCILANIGGDTLFVSTDHPEIVKNVLSSAFYVLTAQEVQEVITDYFRNMNNYRYIDMSGTESMKDMNQADFQKLGKKLTFVINQIASQSSVEEIPRMKFIDFKSVDDFTLLSSPDVKSPMSDLGVTSPIICEGLIVEVKGDDVIQRFKGSVIESHIDQYGDM